MADQQNAAAPGAADNKVLFAVLEYLSQLRQRGSDGSVTVDAESLEVAIDCLGGAVGLAADDEAQRQDLSQASFFSLPQAVAAAEQTLGYQGRLAQFVEALEAKGFFAGAAKGSADYNARLAKATERFNAKYGFDGAAAPAPAAAAAAAPAADAVGELERNARADEYKKQGNAALTGGRLEEAVELYTKAIEMNGANHVYYANRAAAYLHLGRHEECVKDNDTALGLTPDYLKAFLRKGKALAALGRHQEAVDTFEAGMALPNCDDRMRASLKQGADASQAKLAGPAAGGAPGGFDLAGLMSNPAIQQMMSNPAMASMAAQMMGGMGGPPAAADAAPAPAAEAAAPAEPVPAAANLPPGVAQLLADPEVMALREDPELAPVFEDLENNGVASMMKYIGNASVMAKLQPVMNKFMAQMGGGGGGGGFPSM